MKLTTLLLLVTIFNVFGSNAYSQSARLNLDMKDVPLQAVLNAIESQSEFFFLYSSKIIDVTRKVNIQSSNEQISNVLDKLFAGTDISYYIKDRQILLSNDKSVGSAFLQQVKITGIVKDEAGIPLVGTTVQIEGSTVGTITDLNGKYSIDAPSSNSVLIFSFVGYNAQRVPIAGRTIVDVIMIPTSEELTEVVVVAYGTQKKASLTASVDQINTTTLENRPVKTVTEALQNAAAGLYVSVVNGAPQQDLKLNIRGYTGFDTEGSPLVLVDGVERNLSEINPADVESISVLKDASASAIYGSRAPYGIVLVTTKSGKKGEAIKVNYTTNFAFGTPAWMPKMLTSDVFAERFDAFYRNALQAPQLGEAAIKRMKEFVAGTRDSTDIVINGLWGGYYECNANTDWFKLTTRDIIPSQQHNLNFSGGSANTTYYMGLGYDQSVGIFAGIGDEKDRYTALLKVSTDAKDWLNLNLSMNYVGTGEKGPEYNTQGRNYSTIFNWIMRTWPTWPAYYPNGSPYYISIYEQLTGKTGMESVTGGSLDVTGGFKLTPIKGWDITGNYTISLSNGRYSKTSIPLTGLQPNGTIYFSNRSTKQAQIAKQMSDRNYQTVNIFSSYLKEFGDHSFHVLVGFQQELERSNIVNGQRLDLITSVVPSLTLATGAMQVSDNMDHWSTQGYFGRFSYDFKQKYLFEFNGRYDAHSKFPSNIRWAFFPSFSAGWNITKESFWPVKAITTFKVRGSFTNSGDPGSGNYLYLAPMSTTIGAKDVILEGTKPSMVMIPALISNELTWAKPRTVDIGLDIEAFRFRMQLMIDWYQRTIFDQAGPAEPMPTTLGTTAPKKNNAVSETRGWEISTKWRDKGFSIGEKPLNYFAEFRISDYIGYVVKYEGNINGTRSVWVPGQVFGKNYLYESAGIAQTIDDVKKNATQGTAWYYPGDLMLKDLNGDGKIDAGEGNYWYSMGDQVENSYSYPRYRYGITLGADWNGIDFSVLLEGIGKWKIYSSSPWIMGATDQWNGNWFKEQEELGAWTPQTPNAFFFRKAFNTKNTANANDQYAVNLANLKIRNLRLGYALPKGLSSKIKIDRLYVYTSLENLGYIFYKSWIKYDPELIDAVGGQGYPTQRVISFGINLSL